MHELHIAGLCFGKEDPLPAKGWSTDAANVSHAVPLIHPVYALDTTAVNHSPEYANATATPDSFARTLTVARALALTVLEILSDREVLKDIKDEFEGAKSMPSTTPASKL